MKNLLREKNQLNTKSQLKTKNQLKTKSQLKNRLLNQVSQKSKIISKKKVTQLLHLIMQKRPQLNRHQNKQRKKMMMNDNCRNKLYQF